MLAKAFATIAPASIWWKKDIRHLSVVEDALSPVDILTAGFPCQSFSVAGQRRGFDDDRGKLFSEIIRIIGEFGENKPKILLLENVPNLQHGEGGQWFETVASEIQFAGYWFDRQSSVSVLNTAHVSELPQERKRLFMVALSTSAFRANGFQFPKANGAARNLARFIDRSKRAEDSDYLQADNRYHGSIRQKMEQGDEQGLYNLRRYYVREYRDKCPTLTANMGGGGHNVPFIKDEWGIRRLTVGECAALQGFDEYEFPEEVPVKERYRQIGNAVSVPVVTKLGAECARLLLDGE